MHIHVDAAKGGTAGGQTDRQTHTMDGGEQAVDEVLVETLVLAHGEDLLPLGVRQLFLDGLCSDLITGQETGLT